MKNLLTALAALAIFTGSLLPTPSALADDTTPAESRQASASTTEQLQQDLDARAQQDANAMAADAMTAAGDIDLPLEIERTSPRALVLASDL